MIYLDKVQVKEASRVWGDFVEKTAFELDVSGSNIIGGLVAGFTGSKTYDYIQKRHDQKNGKIVAKPTDLTGNNYDDIQSVLRDLKIVFTPINVIFSVNGQVFEIIKTQEMSPEMKEKFLAKDGNYFKNLLVNKMNMELQVAEQIFARRLLQPHLPSALKEANFVSLLMEKASSEDISLEVSESLEKTASNVNIPLNWTLDSLRPFDRSLDFLLENKVEKVASLATPYNPTVVESFTSADMLNNVDVGFLPDRVIYMIDGILIEQMTVMQMNEEGYEAFQKRDKEFFLDFFHEEAKKINETVFADVMKSKEDLTIGKQASEENDDDDDDDNDDDDDDDDDDNGDDDDSIDKEAATLEEVIESIDRAWIEELAGDRENISLFYDHDIHPLVYDAILDKQINPRWHKLELEAVLKEIEVAFGLTEAINDRAIDKIAVLHTIQNENHSMFATSFSFEKFLRAMNNKTVLITTFEGGIEFEEILLALDIAKAVCGESVFLEFGNSVSAYIAEELFNDNIRFVSDQVYDEDNIPERVFWNDVNSFLLRKWRDRDSRGLFGEESSIAKRRTEQVVEIGERVLTTYAEFMDITRPYESTRQVLKDFSLLHGVDEAAGLEQAIVQTTSRHLISAIFLEVKRQEAENTVIRLEEGE